MEKLKDSAEKALILRDSLVKNADGWRFNRRMNSIVSVRSISGATTKAMKNLVLGCLKEKSLDNKLLRHGANDLQSEKSAKKIASNIINMAVTVK